jgi:hypothetical protein
MHRLPGPMHVYELLGLLLVVPPSAGLMLITWPVERECVFVFVFCWGMCLSEGRTLCITYFSCLRLQSLYLFWLRCRCETRHPKLSCQPESLYFCC